MMPYERLEAWRVSYELALAVYDVTRTFPTEERYGLASQSRRAAFSVVANIAEGSARRGPREFRRFLDIALGSLAELACALRLARDLRLIDDVSYARLDDVRNSAGKLVWGLSASMRSQGTR